MHLEKRMFWKVLCHVFVPSSGLDENNIKGAFSPVVPYTALQGAGSPALLRMLSVCLYFIVIPAVCWAAVWILKAYQRSTA